MPRPAATAAALFGAALLLAGCDEGQGTASPADEGQFTVTETDADELDPNELDPGQTAPDTTLGDSRLNDSTIESEDREGGKNEYDSQPLTPGDQ